MNSINKRISLLENKLNPTPKALLVFVTEEDKTPEAAIVKVKKAHCNPDLAEDLPICVFNFLNPQLKISKKIQEK